MSIHFSLDELTSSDYADRHGIDNSPNAEILANINLLMDGLERARTVLDKPMVISSGYRSPKVNAGAGGSKNSYHMRGLAADFTCPGMTPKDVCRLLEAAKLFIQYDKIILEYGRWTHIQFPDVDEEPRMQSFTIMSKETGYEQGIR